MTYEEFTEKGEQCDSDRKRQLSRYAGDPNASGKMETSDHL